MVCAKLDDLAPNLINIAMCNREHECLPSGNQLWQWTVHHLYVDTSILVYGRNPNHQLIGGKHPYFFGGFNHPRYMISSMHCIHGINPLGSLFEPQKDMSSCYEK